MNKNISLMITDGTNDNVYYQLSNVFYGKIKGTSIVSAIDVYFQFLKIS